ncbi:hypothetical protein LTR56_009427 [Elasticomyces elasticus]|nr:hypothetical protein LTR56_009427 [Elasticomyces elasticus]KAK4931052.1 hypothetical protein LTR49_002467 [Elasticomyces elasticus]KAK5765519.1 hypothetical protein LTS12_004270 [Elasticomyces elasticus]
MTWNGLQGFQERPSDDFFVPYHPGMAEVLYEISYQPIPATPAENVAGAGLLGTTHTERGLTFVTVNLAGHEIPQYVPGASYRQLEFLLGRIPSLTTTGDFTTQSGNFTGTTGILQRYDHALRIPGEPHDAAATHQALVLHDQHQPNSYIAEARYRRLEETSSPSNNGYGLSLTETNRWVSHPSVSPSGKRGTSDLTQTAKTVPQQRADSGLGSNGLPENSSLVSQRPVLFSIWRDPTDFETAAKTAPQQCRDNAVHGVGLPESSRWVSHPLVSSNTTTSAQAAKTAQQDRADNVPGLQVSEEVAAQLPGMAAKAPINASINTLENTQQFTRQPVPSDTLAHTTSRPRNPPHLNPKVAAFVTAPSPQPCDVRDVCADHLNGVGLGHDKVHLSGCEVSSCYNKLHICRPFWDSARTGNLSGCGHGGEGVKHKDHRGRPVVHLRPNCHIQYPRQRARTFARARPCENTATRPCYFGHDDPPARRSAADASQWRAPRNVQNEWTGRWEKE